MKRLKTLVGSSGIGAAVLRAVFARSGVFVSLAALAAALIAASVPGVATPGRLRARENRYFHSDTKHAKAAKRAHESLNYLIPAEFSAAPGLSVSRAGVSSR